MNIGIFKGKIMVYLNRVNGDEPVISGQKPASAQVPQTKKTEAKVVPVGQSQDKNQQDIDKLPQGYYVEKSQDAPAPEPTEAPTDEVKDNTPVAQPTEAPADEVKENAQQKKQKSESASDNNDVDIDEPDTNVYPGARITIDNIALGQSDKIDEALAGAEIKGLNAAIEESATKMDKALTMIQTDPHSVLEPKFKKGVHGTGIARYEYTNYSVDIDPGSEYGSTVFKRTTNTKRVDFNGTYESPKGKTKLMLYASGTTTNRHVKEVTSGNPVEQEIPDEQNASQTPADNLVAEEALESRETINQYRLYLGGKFKLGKDELGASVMHAKGASLDNSNTTQIDARYHINNYNVTIDSSTVIYKIGPKTSTKTNISCYFNAKEQVDQTENEPANENQTAEENQTTTANTANKWSKRGGLIIKGESVNGEYEQGLGYYESFRRLGDANSMLKITPFLVASTTPRKEETTSYHATAGVNVKFNKKFNPDSSVTASLDIKDRISFCGQDKGNIFTAFVDANYTNKKFNAKFEGKYIIVPDSKYVACALRAGYKMNKYLQVFGETSYLNQKDGIIKLKGGSFMVGVTGTF